MPLYQTSAVTRYRKIPLTATSVFIFHADKPALRESRTGNDLSVGFETQVKSGKTFAFSLGGAICTAVDFNDPKNESERFCINLLPKEREAVLAAHRAAWGKLWENDIVIEGDLASQQAVRFSLFNLYFRRAGSLACRPWDCHLRVTIGMCSAAWNCGCFRRCWL